MKKPSTTARSRGQVSASGFHEKAGRCQALIPPGDRPSHPICWRQLRFALITVTLEPTRLDETN